MTEPHCQTCAELCLLTNLQWLLLGPVSDSLPDKSGVTLLIPVSLRASAQGEKLVSMFLTATMLWALWGDRSPTCCKEGDLMNAWMDFSAEWLTKPPASWNVVLGFVSYGSCNRGSRCWGRRCGPAKGEQENGLKMLL